MADTGVTYSLQSDSTLLTRVGSRFYDLQSAQPYHPTDYTLTSNQGTSYRLDASGKVQEKILSNGSHLFYSDSGITSSTGETVSFVKDSQGRLTQITAPDGTTIIYKYDNVGELIAVRNLAQGKSTRYGYSNGELTIVSGETGEAIEYGTTPVVSPIKADLGTATQFTGSVVSGHLTGKEGYTFSLRDSELLSTATGVVLLGVQVQGVTTLPSIQGYTPVASHTTANGSYSLFALNKAGLNLLTLQGNGDYTLSLKIAGDVN